MSTPPLPVQAYQLQKPSNFVQAKTEEKFEETTIEVSEMIETLIISTTESPESNLVEQIPGDFQNESG